VATHCDGQAGARATAWWLEHEAVFLSVLLFGKTDCKGYLFHIVFVPNLAATFGMNSTPDEVPGATMEQFSWTQLQLDADSRVPSGQFNSGVLFSSSVLWSAIPTRT